VASTIQDTGYFISYHYLSYLNISNHDYNEHPRKTQGEKPFQIPIYSILGYFSKASFPRLFLAAKGSKGLYSTPGPTWVAFVPPR